MFPCRLSAPPSFPLSWWMSSWNRETSNIRTQHTFFTQRQIVNVSSFLALCSVAMTCERSHTWAGVSLVPVTLTDLHWNLTFIQFSCLEVNLLGIFSAEKTCKLCEIREQSILLSSGREWGLLRVAVVDRTLGQTAQHRAATPETAALQKCAGVPTLSEIWKMTQALDSLEAPWTLHCPCGFTWRTGSGLTACCSSLGYAVEPWRAVPAHRRRPRGGRSLAGGGPQAALLLPGMWCWHPGHGPVLRPEVTAELRSITEGGGKQEEGTDMIRGKSHLYTQKSQQKPDFLAFIVTF